MTKLDLELEILSICIGSTCSSCPYNVNGKYICKEGTFEEKLKVWNRIENPISEDELCEFVKSN